MIVIRLSQFATLLAVLLVLTYTGVCSGSVSDDNPLTREELVDYLSTSLPGVLCAPDRFMMQCFTVTEDECLKTVVRVFKDCSGKMAPGMPEKIETKEEGKKWSGEIGDCVGKSYGLELKEKFVSSDSCQNYKVKD